MLSSINYACKNCSANTDNICFVLELLGRFTYVMNKLLKI